MCMKCDSANRCICCGCCIETQYRLLLTTFCYLTYGSSRVYKSSFLSQRINHKNEQIKQNSSLLTVYCVCYSYFGIHAISLPLHFFVYLGLSLSFAISLSVFLSLSLFLFFCLTYLIYSLLCRVAKFREFSKLETFHGN